MEENKKGRGRPDLPAERKLITVMFADISGFTSLAETMDPEQVRDLINACFEHLVPSVAKYGGTVDKFIGDEIMALFGAPAAHENDPERALRAALSMQEAIGEFSAAHRIQLDAHFGINTGLVIAGGIGTRGRQDYSVMGDAVNLAAHLGRISQRGEILVGPDTYRQTSHLFDFKALGPMRLKGKADSVPVYKLLGLRAQPGTWRGLEGRGISSPLIGREEEVAAFTRCIERLLAGQGGLVSIIGEAGLGKSRLVAEIRRQVAKQDILWLEGRTLSFSQTISYWPFLEIIQADVGIIAEDNEGDCWNKLERRINMLFPDETAEILPYLATLLTLEVPGELAERVKYLDGETMGRQVFRTARLYFSRLAQERPLVLIFEDMHWTDQSSAFLLEHLLPLVREAPLLLCSLGRADAGTPAMHLWETQAKEYADCYTEIHLTPLSPLESIQLAHNLLKIEDFPPRLREGLFRKAEGNPFFLEEMIRALIDLGAFVRNRNTGRWQATAKVEQITIPDTLQGVVIARIDRLNEEVKQVLKLASVIGRVFFYRVLRGILEADRELDRHLAELQNLELVREKNRIPEIEYIFKHALVQEATYESILLQRRREIHRQVGECVEAIFADRLDEFYGLLAYHYTRAEEWEKARDYLFKAGDQAGKIAADVEALEHYRQAMAAHTRAFGNRWDPLQRAILERKMGEALFRRGQNQPAREYLLRALISLRSPYPHTRRGVQLAIFKQLIRQMGHRLLPSFLRENKSGEKESISQEICQIYSVMAWMDYFMDPHCLFLDSLLILNLAERCGFSVEVVLASMGVGLAFNTVPASRLARYYHGRAVALAEQIRQPIAIGQAYFGLALHEQYALGDGARALEHYHRSARGYWEAGHLRCWASVKMAESLLWIPADINDRLNLCQEVIQVSQDAADHQAWGWGLFMLATTLDEAGALDEAVAKMRQALDLLKSVPDYQVIVFASGILGRCYLRQGNIQQALAILEEGGQLIKNHRLRGFSCVPIWMSLAQTYLSAAEQVEEPGREAAMRKAKQACKIALNQEKFDRASRVAACRMQGTWEWLRGQSGRARKWWQQSLKAGDALGARYELGLTHLEMGKFLEDPAHLKSAEKIFGAIGANFDLAQARKLMERRGAPP
ncbi:MAG: adenylate/guanylate cyclase domain-containing protein [Thermodesulfobacteriota bacterium]|nr:adenylate/guanylate cyclase domain-containing protein [Thermodesulfobacteriota bacterium]